ncbi:hypothetical protein Hte_001806 [Hypoxylon texense]
MEQRDHPYEASEPDKLPDVHTDTQAFPSQPDFIHPLEDSQDTTHNDVGEYSASQQHTQNPYPTQQTSGSFFVRPTIETTEEIGATFQFHTPPSTRNVFHNPTAHKTDVRDPGIESRVSDIAKDTVESHGSPKATASVAECVGEPGSGSGQNTPSLPFPDETQSLHVDGKKHIHSHSSLANARLPKSIADTRQKALAQLSKAPQRIRNETSVERNQPSSRTASSETMDVAPPSRKHPQAKHHKTQSFMRPLSGKALDERVATTASPCSQASNIAKHRAPPVRHRQRGSPTREKNSIYLKKFAESWNANYLYNQKLLDHLQEKVYMQERHIEDQDSIIEQYRRDIESRDETIGTLSKEIEEVHKQSQAVHDEIAADSAARKKLEEKLRSCRSRLNDAINEQQRLFLRCRERFEETIAHIKEESQVQKDSVEKVATMLEQARAEIKQEVLAVANDANVQINELTKTIQTLEAQLGQSEQELEHQRCQAANLREQLAESHRLNNESLQLVAAQNRELLEKLNRDRQQADATDKHIQELGQKIDTVLAALAEAKLRTVDRVALAESLEGFHNDTVNAIVTEMQNSAQSARNSALNDQQGLNDNVDQIRILCTSISDGMSEVRDVAEWQNRASEADKTVQDQLHQIQNLHDELHQSRTLVQHKSEEQLELQRQLGVLQANAEREKSDLTILVQELQESVSEKDAAVAKSKEDLAATQQREIELSRQVGILQANAEKKRIIVADLTTQLRKLQSNLSEKDTVVTESERNLAATREELRREVRKLQDKEEQFQNERHAIAQEKERLYEEHRLNRMQLQEEHRLKEIQLQEGMDRERAQLEQELTESRQAVEGIRAGANEDIHQFVLQIRGELAAANTPVTELKASLEESELRREALQESLEQWSHDRVEIGQMQQRIQRLAKEQPNAIEMSRGLKELLEMQRMISGTVDYHETQLANVRAMVAVEQAQQNESMAPTNGAKDGVEYLGVEALNLTRKVMLKSPDGEDDRASPVSVEQEKSTRRRSVPPRGIMKLPTSNASGDLEAAGSGAEIDSREPQPPPNRKIAKRGLKPSPTNRSLYNRPVSGSVSKSSIQQDGANQVGSSGHRDDAGGEDGLLQDVDEPPMKRQRISKGRSRN